jgi:hypothetical protein
MSPFRSVALSAVVFAWAGNQTASAQTYMGLGGFNCALYSTMAVQKDPRADSVDDWLLGYVSGLNMVWKRVKGVDPLVNVETPQVLAYVRRYCTANPQRTVLNGINDYLFSLPQ